MRHMAAAVCNAVSNSTRPRLLRCLMAMFSATARLQDWMEAGGQGSDGAEGAGVPLRWARVVAPPRRRGRHVLLDLCVAPPPPPAPTAPQQQGGVGKDEAQRGNTTEQGQEEQEEDEEWGRHGMLVQQVSPRPCDLIRAQCGALHELVASTHSLDEPRPHELAATPVLQGTPKRT